MFPKSECGDAVWFRPPWSVCLWTHLDYEVWWNSGGKQGRYEQIDVEFEMFKLPFMEKVTSSSQTLIVSNQFHYAGFVSSVLCEAGVTIYVLKISTSMLLNSVVFRISASSCFSG